MRWRHVTQALSLAMVIPAVAEAHGGGSSGDSLGDWLDELLLGGVVLGALFLIGVILVTGRADKKIDREDGL